VQFIFEHEKKSYRYKVILPVSCSKFIEPLKIDDSNSFFTKWNSIEKGLPLEKQQILPLNHSVDEISQVLTDLKFQVLTNVDSNKNNIVAAGMFYTGSNENQGVLIRVETNNEKKALRLTIRSTNGLITENSFETIEGLLI